MKTSNLSLNQMVIAKDYEGLNDALSQLSATSFPLFDDKGYSPYYYAAVAEDETALKILRKYPFKKWVKNDLQNAIVNHDMHGLECLMASGLDCHFINASGHTLSDLALIHDNYEAHKLLRSEGLSQRLTLKEVEEYKKAKDIRQKAQTNFEVSVTGNAGQFLLEINEKDAKGNIVEKIKINPWQKAAFQDERCKIVTKDASCFVYLIDDKNPTQPKALYELDKKGKLTLHFANHPQSALSVKSDAGVEVKSIALVQSLKVQSDEFTLNKEAKVILGEEISLTVKKANLQGCLAGKKAKFDVKDTLNMDGEITLNELEIQAGKVVETGKTIIANTFDAKANTLFDLQGEWISGKQGKIAAHKVVLAAKSVLISQNDEIKIFAKSKIENGGAILAKFVNLEAGLAIDHYYGSMVKALSGTMYAPQVNKSGFIIIGQKNALSCIDWAINVAQASVNLAQIASLLPLPTALELRGYLLVAKTLYRGGEIFYKLIQGQESEVSQTELITCFLDNVIPSLGALTSQHEKAQLLVNILYHLYGAAVSEEDFVQRSLRLIEALSRGLAFCSTDTKWLADAANMIRCTRYALKLTDISLEALSAWQSNDPEALDKTIYNVKTLAEGVFREVLYTLPPTQLLETTLFINPRDIALFILNKGHTSELFLQSVLYGALNVAKRQGLINESSGFGELQLCLQMYFRTKAWQNLYHAYQNKQMTTGAVITEAIQGLLVVLNYQAQREMTARHQTKESIEEKVEPKTDVTPPVQEEPPIPEVSEKPVEAANEEQPVPVQEAKVVQPETPAETYDFGPPVDDFLPISEKPAESQEQVTVPVEEETLRTPEELQAQKVAALAANHHDIPEYKKEVLTLDVSSLVENELSQQLPTTESLGLKQACEMLLELQRAINGEYAAAGHFSGFMDALHQEGILESTGGISLYASSRATNNNVMRSATNIAVYGNRLAGSFFKNLESGTMTAQDAVYFACVDILNNHGLMSSGNKIRASAIRIVKNHKEGQMIAKEDIDMLAEVLAENAGFISGKNVNFQGADEKSVNAGVIYASENIKLMSTKLVELSKSGSLSAKRVSFEGKEVVKDGSVRARLVKTLGDDSPMPEKVTWRNGKEDAIGGLVLKAAKPLEYEEDAFNNVSVVDVTLAEEATDGKTLFSIDPNFASTLQLHLPSKQSTLTLSQLPQLSKAGKLILDAPGHTLQAETNPEQPFPYKLTFTGESFDYSDKQATFANPLALDVREIQDQGAKSRLTLNKGGFLQAELFHNQGKIHSDDVLEWNVKALENNAQLEYYNEYFQHSLRNPTFELHRSSKIAEGSGQIYAKGHRGYLGNFSQYGGKFLSGEEGTSVYYETSVQEAALTHQGKKTDTVVHDSGRNWHVTPTWANAEIGSKGTTVLLGKGIFLAKGLDFWGDKGGYLHSNEKVVEETQSASYHIDQVLSLKKSGKVQAVIHPNVASSVLTQNNIASDEGVLTVVSEKGDIDFTNTVLSSASDINLLANGKVSVSGTTASYVESSHYKKRGFLKKKSVTSHTAGTKAYSSFIFGNLVVRADEFHLSGVQGVMTGADIVVPKVVLSGIEQSSKTKTVTTQSSIEIPAVNNLNAILNGHNAKAVFKTFINSCGWSKEDLNALLHADSAAKLPGPLVNVGRNAWNLTALVAHACNEYGQSPQQFVGAITDQMGLTVLHNGKRIFNPHFDFKTVKTTEEIETSQMIPTKLYVGGTFRLIGNELEILDGSEVDAGKLRIFLNKGIKATKGVDTYKYSAKTKTTKVGINPLNPTDLSVGVEKSTTTEQSQTVHLAKLHARDTAVVEAKESIVGELTISADKGGKVVAPEISLTSGQSFASAKSKTVGVSVNTNLMVGGHAHSQEMHQSSTERAGIFMPNGEVVADKIHLEQGAKIETGVLRRHDGQEGLPTVTGSSSLDTEKATSKGFGFHVVPGGESEVSLQKDYSERTTLHRPTVLASNVKEGDLPGINTSKDKETEVIKEKRGGYSVVAFNPDLEKIAAQAKDIQQVVSKGVRWLSQPELDKALPQPDAMQSTPTTSTPLIDKQTRPAAESLEKQEAQKNANPVVLTKKTDSKKKTKATKVKGDAKKKSEVGKSVSVPILPAEVDVAPKKISKATKVSKKSTKDSWLKMAWRSFRGEDSPEIREWRRKNRKATPGMAAFADGVTEQREKVNAPLGGFKKYLGDYLDLAVEDTQLAITEYKEYPAALKLKKRVLQAAAFGVDTFIPGSTDEIAIGVITGGAAGAGGKILLNKGLKWGYELDKTRKVGKSLGAHNLAFKGKEFDEIGKSLTARGFSIKGKNPVAGNGSYFHPITKRKYYLDHAKKPSNKEYPHVDVHRKNIETGEYVEHVRELPKGTKLTEPKRKYPLGDKLYMNPAKK